MKTEKKILVTFILIFSISLGLLNAAGAYFYILFSYMHYDNPWRGLKHFSGKIIFWELILIISVGYIFYKLLVMYIKEKERRREFLEMLLLAVSHKFGNFLTTQRINLEMLKEDDNPLTSRLIASCDNMNRDFDQIINTIKLLGADEQHSEKIRLKSLIEEIISELPEETAKKEYIRTRMDDITVTAPPGVLKIILHNIIENCMRYSQSNISIRLTASGKWANLAIKNDIRRDAEGGRGIGLHISEKLCGMCGMKLKYRVKENRFFLILQMPHKKARCSDNNLAQKLTNALGVLPKGKN